MRSSLLRALALMVGSGVTAEFLLGDQYLGGLAPVPQQVGELVVFIVFYGSGALLIRELARRTGRGWPTIFLLGGAFGVLEEGVLDQSLFNPHFAGADLLSYGFVPALGIGVPWTLYVLTLHVIWSVGAPIAVTEGLFPRPTDRYGPTTPQHQARWLGRLGLVLATLGYLVGAAAVFGTSWWTYRFVASPAQLVVSGVVAAVLVVVALRLPRRSPRESGSYVVGVVVGLVGTSAFQLLRRLPGNVSPWLLSVLLVAVLVAGALVSRLVHADAVGLGTGAVLTYGWLGLTSAVAAGRTAVVEQAVLVVLAVGVLILAGRRHRAGLVAR